MQQDIVTTDGQLQEIIEHGTRDYPINSYLDDFENYCNLRINPHWHREIEFSFVWEGTVEHLVGNESVCLEKGEGIFINTRVIHGYEPRGKTVVPNIVLSPALIAGGNQLVYSKFVEPILNMNISYLKLGNHIDWQGEILRYLERMFHQLRDNSEMQEIEVQLLATSIWRLLYMHRGEYVKPQDSSASITVQARLRLMLEFISRHYGDKISLADIAGAASISKNEAMRCFREGAGISPVDYLIQFRLNKGRELLMETEKPVTEIASSVGFEYVSYFDRMFKRAFGLTPKALRKR